MSDPKTQPTRGSKTAAVVMLVVFLQVLVVAVLGLSAISRDRQEARRVAEERAEDASSAALDRIVRGAVREVEAALVDVREVVKRYADLELLRSRGHKAHADLIRLIYHVDPDSGAIYWLDGSHRVYLPPRERERVIRASADPGAAAVFRALERDAETLPDNLRRIRKSIELIRGFPYWQHQETGFPMAVGAARRLVPFAFGEATLRAYMEDGPVVFVDLENALLAALEVVALNRDRIAVLPEGDHPLLAQVEQEVVAVTTALEPEQRAIQQHVEAYMDAHRELDHGGMRDVLAAAMREMGANPKVVAVGTTLVGLVPMVRADGSTTTRHGVVVLSDAAMKELLQQQADVVALAREGLAFHLVPREEARGPEAAASRDLRPVEGLRLPLRAELRRTHPLDLPVEGPGELFYWGIILLAAGGLGMGGYVLSRLYTREVRLARLKADFISNLSHELKTPLTSIGLFSEMLQDGQLQSEADRQEGLAVLVQESQRLQAIVSRMLETARREARGVPYDLKPGDLNAVARRAGERFRRIVTEPGLHLDLQLAEQPLPMLMDKAAVDDVITNLITNAWKYRRGTEAHIKVRTARRGRILELVVDDDGLGIPRRDRRRVFEMFYRSDAYLTKVAGTGLGLSLVRTIVRAHRGRIRVEMGESGQGSLFRLRFPVGKVARPGSTPSEAPVGSATRSRSEAQAAS